MRRIGHPEFLYLSPCSMMFLGLASGCVPQLITAPVAVADTVSVITDAAPGRAAAHGLSELCDSLRAHGVTAMRGTERGAARGSMRIVTGLRRRGVQIASAAELGLLGAEDERHLDHATGAGHTVLTSDDDFLRLVAHRLQSETHHPGVLFILPRTSGGDAIRAVALVAQALGPTEMHDRIVWIP